MFQKRHYEAIAQCIQDMHGFYTNEQHSDIALQFADMLRRDNPRFDRSRFLHACKPGSNVKARTAHLRA